MSHTPGPWMCEFKSGAHLVRDTATRPRAIAQVVYWTQEDTQNAQLISAAPEMYAALKMILQTHEVSCKGEDCEIGGIDLGKLAIAKAEGR